MQYQAFCTRYGGHWSLMAVFIPWCIGMFAINYNHDFGWSLVIGGLSVSASTTIVDLSVPKILRARRVGMKKGSAIYQRIQFSTAMVATLGYLLVAAHNI